jgi:hypothetical protein
VTRGDGWHRQFHEPIKVDDRTLRTLRDTANYTVALPEKASSQEHWQIAVRHLMLAILRRAIEPYGLT